MLLDYKKFVIAVAVLLCIMTTSVVADKIHDPTMPKFVMNANLASNVSANIQQESLLLQGIVNKKDAKMAIISGQLHKVGDVVQGFKIGQINNNNVVLLKSGSQKRLYVYEK